MRTNEIEDGQVIGRKWPAGTRPADCRTVEPERVAFAPVASDDGRPLFLLLAKHELWAPDPPRDGDPVYCRGFKVGTFHGEYRTVECAAGLVCQHWSVTTVATADMPPDVAAVMLATRSVRSANA